MKKPNFFWSKEETKLLLDGLRTYGFDAEKLSNMIPTRTLKQVN